MLEPGGPIPELETRPPSGPVKPVVELGMRVVVPLPRQIVAR
ncbi:hypothetical protein [Nocardia sienata]|nr:hypothetical protein [Nocardia sienata]